MKEKDPFLCEAGDWVKVSTMNRHGRHHFEFGTEAVTVECLGGRPKICVDFGPVISGNRRHFVLIYCSSQRVWKCYQQGQSGRDGASVSVRVFSEATKEVKEVLESSSLLPAC